jgi:chitinase
VEPCSCWVEPEMSRMMDAQLSLLGMPRLALLALLAAASAAPAAAASHRLPSGAVIAGYTNQGNASTILHAVDQGVNVLIWSFIELQGNVTDDPIQEGPDPATLRAVVTALHRDAVQVTHLVSIGGWGADHPDTARTGDAWWETWKRWDADFAKRVALPELWVGFAGVDLDVEGADTKGSPANSFPTDLIELCGTFALAAKRDGYISTMVPPQSYLECGVPRFDPEGSVEHADEWAESFAYHGQNTYAPLLAKYAHGYDLVIIQLYEGFSRAGHAILDQHVEPTTYLTELARNCSAGWEVDFEGAYGLQKHTISVPASKLVIGLANGWATQIEGGSKFLYIDGEAAGKAFTELGGTSGLRGFGYWCVPVQAGKCSVHLR